MILKTKCVEVEYSRGLVFLVRLPLVGQLLWTHTEGWQYNAAAKA
jgi:hypothetical protein